MSIVSRRSSDSGTDRVGTSGAFPKFESYGMLETAASVGWKVKDAIVGFHGIGRLVINLKFAKDLTIPPSLVAIVDAVIE
jgi:hypothetical protein